VKQITTVACAVFLFFVTTKAMSAEEQAPSRKMGMAGIATSGIAAGVQIEYRFIRPLGIRAMGISVYGTGKKHGPIVSKGETLIAAIATPAFYIPTPVEFLEPVLFFGLSYSHYRWKSPYFKISGVLDDITFGGGGGLGFIVAPFCRIGVNCWINYDYRIIQEYGIRKKGKRIALPMPFIDVSFLF